jgi:head-tail adaptor
MPNVNNLTNRIELWKYDRQDNSGGTPIETYKFYRYVYAGMKVRSGTTEANSLGLLPNTNVEWTIRFDDTVDYRVQIKYYNKFYKIDHIEILGRQAWMKIQSSVYNEAEYNYQYSV